ncbi:hypothetical protein SUDANB145_05519 [Streptomyces sp. enrichment culture]
MSVACSVGAGVGPMCPGRVPEHPMQPSQPFSPRSVPCRSASSCSVPVRFVSVRFVSVRSVVSCVVGPVGGVATALVVAGTRAGRGGRAGLGAGTPSQVAARLGRDGVSGCTGRFRSFRGSAGYGGFAGAGGVPGAGGLPGTGGFPGVGREVRRFRRYGRFRRSVGRVRQFGPDQQPWTVLLRTPGVAQGIDQEQSSAVLVLGLPPGRRLRLTRRAPLVPYGYADQVGAVGQLAHYAAARRVHDGVGDQLRDDQSRCVAGVLTHRPAGQPGARQASGLGGGTRMGGQLEAEPALGSRPAGGGSRGGARAVGARGGLCS